MLLGRLGEHKAALSIYAYKLQNFAKAEEYVIFSNLLRVLICDRYCKIIYQASPSPQGIYMTLLKLYLRPEDTSQPAIAAPYLRPALDLISRHSPRLDAVETLQLLPPLVTASDVSEYLCEALRTPRVDVRLEKELWKARSEQLSRQLMLFESKRVKITDGRL